MALRHSILPCLGWALPSEFAGGHLGVSAPTPGQAAEPSSLQDSPALDGSRGKWLISSCIAWQPFGANGNPMVMPACWEWGPSSVFLPHQQCLCSIIFQEHFLAKFLLLRGADHTQTSLLILSGTLIALRNSLLTHRLSRNIRHLLLFSKQKQ